MLKISAKVLILFITSATWLSAQTPAETRTPFRFGIHASPNISYIATSDPTASGNVKLKFGFGLITEFNFADNYSFSTGIDYFFRGAELTVTDPDFQVVNPGYDGPVKGDYRSGFVQVPLMLKMRTRPFGYYTFFADFGGNVGISTDESTVFQPGANEVKDSYIRFAAVMFSIGLGGEYDLGGATSLLLGVYYNRSLFDNLNSDAPGDLGAYTYRFDYVNLKLGVLF